MKYQIKCADPEQHSMFYSDCEPALRNACVGHLRMDFGSDNDFVNITLHNFLKKTSFLDHHQNSQSEAE